MPAILTHDFFGRDAYDDVSASRGFVTPQQRQAFLLGNQGPDPLFYLVADPFVGSENRVGGLMHHAKPARLLSALRDALTMLTRDERPVGDAYAAGFLCHYLLDRSMHPLVYAYQYALCDAGVSGLDRSDGDEVHAEIERDLDEMVLYAKTGMTVRTFKPYREVLRADDATLAVIDKLYFYMNLWAYSRTLDQDCYLRIATELHLKRCIVGGMERVFELGRQFRNEGMDLTHNPEFTSMEAYCAYSDLEGMKRLTEGLFTACREAVGLPEQFEYQGATVNMAVPFRSAPMAELVSEKVGEKIDMETPVEHARQILDRLGLEYDQSWGIGRLIFTIYDELCEGDIVDPTFVCDYPVEVSPLAKRKDDDPRLTDRFELVVAGHEYANAFSELNDPVDQEGRFAAQVAAKAAGDDEAMEYDYDYIRALEYGMPPAGGIGYGIDRMVMLFTNSASIRDVLLFPHMRPERRAVAAAPADGKLESGISREQAYELLAKYNEDPFHIKHGETLEGLMRYFAEREDPENVEFWGLVGLLHDLDWEKWPDAVHHTEKTAELLEEAGANPALARSIQTHNCEQNEELPKPELQMEKWLYATDELSGLIQACAKMRPSKSVTDMQLKSLKKKFKTKSFAAGCNRDIIRQGAEMLGLELDELFAQVIDAMKAIAPVGDIYAQPEEPKEEEPQIPQEGIYIEPLFADEVDFGTFSKSDFRVVKVKECEEVPKSKKLLRFLLDDGTGTDRTILSGIKEYYRPEELVGKTLVAIVNLPPRKMMGIDSCGMLLSALHTEDGKEALQLLMLDDAIPAGAKLY